MDDDERWLQNYIDAVYGGNKDQFLADLSRYLDRDQDEIAEYSIATICNVADRMSRGDNV